MRHGGQNVSAMPRDQVQTLDYELQVHQIELLMQNEELRRTEAELTEIRDRYFELFELAPIGYVTIGPDYRIGRCNLSAAELLGTDRSKIGGAVLAGLMAPEDRDACFLAMRETLESGAPQTCECAIVRTAGKKLHVQLSIVPVNKQSPADGCRVTLTDVTAMKEAEQKVLHINEELEAKVQDRIRDLQREVEERHRVEQAEHFLRSTIDGLGAHICVIDGTGRILVTNRAWKNFGAENNARESAIGEGVSYFDVLMGGGDCDRAEAEAFHTGISSVLAGDSPEFVREYACHSEHAKRWSICRVNPFFVDDRRYAIIAHEDITQRRLAEDALRNTKERLEATINALPDLMFRADCEGRIRECRSRDAASFHVSPAVSVGKKFAEVLPEEPTRIVEAALAEAAVHGSHRGATYMIPTPHGKMSFELSIAAMGSDADAGQDFIVLVRDISERVRTADALAEAHLTAARLASEQRLAAVIGQSLAGVAEIDLDRRLVYVNNRLCEILGYSRDELLGRRLEEFVPPEDASITRAQFEVFLNCNAIPAAIERCLRRSDGMPVWTRVSGAAIHDSAGNPVSVLCILLDITERKLAEEALREERQRLASIIRASNVGTWEWDLRTGGVAFNDRWSEIAGYSLAELAPVSMETWRQLAHPDDYQASQNLLEKHLRNESAYFAAESRMRHRDGSWLWVLDRGQVTSWTSDGRPLLMRGIRQEITRLKQMTDRLRTFSKAIESSPWMVMIADPEGRIEYVNPAWEQVTGFRLDEVVGQNPRFLQSGVHSREFYAQLWGEITTGRVWRGELRNRKKKGECYWESAAIAPLLDDTGRISHFVAVKADISERHAMEDKIRQWNAELERKVAERTAELTAANASKDEFLATMSHEIRTPMNGVIGMTGLLLDTALDDDQRHYAEAIRSSGESLLALVNDVLDFSKLEAGKLGLELLDFNLRDLLESFAAPLAVRARCKGIEFDCAAEPNVPVKVTGAPGRLRQILTNLAGNAVKFTEHGQVTVRVSLVAETETDVLIRFAVRDTGIGIPPELQQKLFQKFTQADTSTTRRYGGTGLGLAISKQLAEMMGGEIGVNSQPGVGSEFWFTVPLGKTAPPKSLAQGSEKTADFLGTASGTLPAVHRRGARILVAEDNIVNQEVAIGILNKLRIRADAVADGTEAVEALKTLPYDLVLMDMQMPEMDGLEATRIIRDPLSPVMNHQIPVIAMTANAMRGDRQRCLEAGMNDYISKPVSPQALVDALNKWLPRENPSP